jgi:hypothetical protein
MYILKFTKHKASLLFYMGVKVVVSREQYRLRVSENRVLRRIFGPKGEEVIEDRRKLHYEELHNLYSLQNIINESNQCR